jgi:hypothetical protein
MYSTSDPLHKYCNYEEAFYVGLFTVSHATAEQDALLAGAFIPLGQLTARKLRLTEMQEREGTIELSKL